VTRRYEQQVNLLFQNCAVQELAGLAEELTRMLKMLRVGWFVLLWVGMVQAQLLPGDLEAKAGDYPRAEALYKQAESQADDRLKRRLLCRRLALAQATNDVGAAKELGTRLERALKDVDDPEVAMRLYLLRGAIAYRTRDLTGAREAFKKARELAQQQVAKQDPGGGLGMYECLSYDYLSKVNSRGGARLEDRLKEYESACRNAADSSQRLPASPTRPYWALDVYRSIFWTRLWIWQAWEYSYLAYRHKSLDEAGAWQVMSAGIGELSGKIYQAAYAATSDQEFFSAGTHAVLELTEGFPLNPGVTPLPLSNEVWIRRSAGQHRNPTDERAFCSLVRTHQFLRPQQPGPGSKRLP
jgi:hypothetical protein